MNTRTSFRNRFLLAAALPALLLGACSDRQPAEPQVDINRSVQNTQDAVTGAWDDLRNFTIEQRQEFSSNARALASKVDAEMSELRAEAAEGKASASRRAAMEELSNARADFDQKLAALQQASADTWESAKANVVAAAERLQAAWRKARAETT